MEIIKPTYEELEVEVNRLRKLQESNMQANDAKDLDVTEQKHTEQVLRVSEARYRGLLQNIKAGIVVHAPDSSVVMNNPRAAELLGLSDDQMKGKAAIDTAWEFINEDHTPLLPDEYPVSQIAISKKSIKNKVWGVQHSGKNNIVWLIVNGFPVLNNKGEITEIVISFIDVSERKKAEKSLKTSKEALENLTNSLTDIVISVKMPERVIEWCNNSIRTIEYEPDEIIGQTTAFLYTDEENYLDFVIRLQQSLKEGHAVFITEQLFKKKNGEIFSADVRVTCDLEDGKMVRTTSIIRDITKQKEIVENLKNEKKFLEAVFDSISDGIVSCDANGVLNRFNQATKEFHGLPDIPIAADKWAEHYDIFFPDGETPMQETDVPLFRALTEGIVQNVEMMIIPKKGKKRLLVSNGKVLKDIDGKTLGAVVAMHDITEQKQIQQELKNSEEKYRALFENAPLSYQSLDKDGRFIDINPSWLRTLGYERDEVIGKFYADFLHPDWKPHFEKNFPAFKKRGYVNDVQFKIRHKKGHYIDISFEGCIGYLPDGSFKQTYCVFQDITERKTTENIIIKSKERLKLALETNKTGAWELNLSNHTSTRTLLHDQIFGYETALSEWTFEIFLEHVIPEDREKTEALFVEAIKTISDWDFECRIRRPDGEIRWINAIGRPIVNSEGKPSHLSGVVQDITERKQAEDELKKHKENLEGLVDERTKELENKNKLLEKINKAFVGRELKMKELKQEIKSLKEER